MELPDSPPPVYALLEGALPPPYTLGNALGDAFSFADVLVRVPPQSGQNQARVIASNDEEKETPGFEDVPTEILHSIICMACSLSCDDLLDLHLSRRTILSCTGVSRKWMAVTLSHKELWSRVLDFTLHSAPTIWLLLIFTDPFPFNVGHRSTPVVLSWANEGHRDIRRIIQLIYTNRSRIRELHVEWSFGGAGLLSHVCHMDSPLLEAVTWHKFDTHPTEAFAHPIHILPQVPLKRLDIRHANIRLQPAASLNQLTALSMYHSPYFSFPEWLNFLRFTPKLLFLSIHCSIRIEGHIPGFHVGGLKLAHLALLTIGSSTSDEAERHICLLAAIRFPPTCGLRITALPYLRGRSLPPGSSRTILFPPPPFHPQ